MIANLRASIKMLGFFFLAITFFSLGIILYPAYLCHQNKFRKLLIQLTRLHAKALVWILNIKMEIEGASFFNSNSNKGKLIVSNHLSYVDVIALMSLYPTCFVTSIEMKNAPFLGQICQVAGCLFVERRNRQNLDIEIQEITRALENGDDVTIFPESTSTNGDSVLRFKRPLFKAAINANTEVYPICLNYKKINLGPITSDNRDIIFWYGEMTFFSHFFNIMRQHEIILNVEHLQQITSKNIHDHSELASASHVSIAKHFKPIENWITKYVNPTRLTT